MWEYKQRYPANLPSKYSLKGSKDKTILGSNIIDVEIIWKLKIYSRFKCIIGLINNLKESNTHYIAPAIALINAIKSSICLFRVALFACVWIFNLKVEYIKEYKIFRF